MDDLISRRAAITLPVTPKEHREYQTFNLDDAYEQGWDDLQKFIEALPSAPPETSRIENTLHGKSAEEQYDFLQWLMQDYGRQFTDTRVAVIEWLKGECNG